MPQLVRGGKWVYGWSVVGMDCRVPVPEEAKEEYGLSSDAGVIVMSGSRSSRGFAITTMELLSGTSFHRHFEGYLEFLDYYEKNRETDQGPHAVFTQKGKVLSRVFLDERCLLHMWRNLLQQYYVFPFDRLLSVRGSSHALAFIVSGRLVQEAKKHPELRIYENSSDTVK